jgi:hypothetical protein
MLASHGGTVSCSNRAKKFAEARQRELSARILANSPGAVSAPTTLHAKSRHIAEFHGILTGQFISQ